MAHAVQKVEQTNSALSDILSIASSQKPAEVKAQEAKILQLDRSKSLNRFLEASCDCV